MSEYPTHDPSITQERDPAERAERRFSAWLDAHQGLNRDLSAKSLTEARRRWFLAQEKVLDFGTPHLHAFLDYLLCHLEGEAVANHAQPEKPLPPAWTCRCGVLWTADAICTDCGDFRRFNVKLEGGEARYVVVDAPDPEVKPMHDMSLGELVDELATHLPEVEDHAAFQEISRRSRAGMDMADSKWAACCGNCSRLDTDCPHPHNPETTANCYIQAKERTND